MQNISAVSSDSMYPDAEMPTNRVCTLLVAYTPSEVERHSKKQA